MKRQCQAAVCGVAVILISLLIAPLGRGQPASGLVAHYRFEGDAKDSSGHGLDGVAYNTGYAPAQIGQGVDFTGQLDSYIEVPNHELLNVTEGVTISAWVMLRKYAAGAACLIYKAAATPTGEGFSDRSYALWVWNDGNVEFSSTAEGESWQTPLHTAAGAVQLGVFHHVAAVVDAATQTMTIFVNGQQAASRDYPRNKIRTGDWPLRLGAPFQTLGDQWGMDGILDEVRIYGRALSSAEIAELAQEKSRGPVLSIAVENVRICFGSKNGRFYQVQYRSESTTNQWTDLGAPLVGTGAAICLLDTVAGQSRKFYRVIELP